MIKVKEAVIVEGKYDKIRLSSLIDGLIITTDGFGIFKDKEKMQMLRRLAETRGLLIITDSDSAGFVIRNHLKSCIPPEHIKHAYIPDVFGKERRKTEHSKEGKIGVEGMTTEVLTAALQKAGVICADETSAAVEQKRMITRQDFFRAGLSGGEGSSARRAELLAFLGLPQRMTANALLGVINDYMTWEQFAEYFGV
ncbi:MAG: toprim domain-containing protein [Acutalibacteraceae bacterium]